MQSASVLEINDIEELERGFELSLRSRNRAAKTIKSYVEALRLFRGFLVRSGMPTEIDKINREHVEAFIADQLQRWRSKTAHVRYGDLRQFFRWAVDDGEIPISPMVNMVPPTVPEVPVPIVSDEDLKRLLKTTEGKSFEQRRDAALLRVLIDCGIRLAELTITGCGPTAHVRQAKLGAPTPSPALNPRSTRKGMRPDRPDWFSRQDGPPRL